MIKGGKLRPRLAVFRSLKHISAQVIDDTVGRTIVAAHDWEVPKSLKSMERAAAVGRLIGEKAKNNGIESAVFDRRHYKFHGRVKALAEAARGVGLKF
ncbi:MAG: 50S ribosomal protein L18 [Parcubacteria group bacterium GW2011_GWA2_46_9]|nr:MAG: 50S ribosomal protein L18 [Parcubacteria group bacterium GW2011_GWA2_46_9]